MYLSQLTSVELTSERVQCVVVSVISKIKAIITDTNGSGELSRIHRSKSALWCNGESSL